MPRSLEAGVPEVQHSKRTNPKAVVNDCFTLPVVWGLAAAEREELTQSMQPPAPSPTPPRAPQSNRRMHQEPRWPLGALPCPPAAKASIKDSGNSSSTGVPYRKCTCNKQHKQHTVCFISIPLSGLHYLYLCLYLLVPG